ncbi:MAG: bifunctional 4-hydroxy-2-oxoglutarate aldolase/2-dehydro-3-deoxy-phosphogluconate aldolase [Rickettsiales bacterium]|nr:bifunctional 4-hydroxy-2-oxoglutarate aldolase/2-dehydro-3-deoxy-phosphogluconate aldolase [Rickettsiales bacterium]
MSLESLLRSNRVVPVVVLQKVEHAVPLARALLKGGVNSMEITLRTDAGLASIEAVAKQVPEITVGAGTVINAQQYKDAVNAGAKFIVSPGLTPALAETSRQHSVHFLPGVVTPTEVITALQEGFRLLKFFPASLFGGQGVLKQYGSVFPDALFCPTGGIDQHNASGYLTLPNVVAVGGSWMTPKDAVAEGDWELISAIAQESLGSILTPIPWD